MELRFVVVTHCNADCYFCLNEYVGTKSPEYSMYPLHYGKVMEAAECLTVNDCTITGGEPTLRKDLADIVVAIRGHSSRVTLISNGYRLVNHQNAMMHIDELHISYHSMNDSEWERITKVRNGPSRVAHNLRKTREVNQTMRIKLNVVAEEQNSSSAEITKYLNFAREIGADLNIFKEGYFSFLSEFGVQKKHHSVATELWPIQEMGGTLLGSTYRKKTYLIEDVRVSLSHTSTDKPSWDSCWVTPMGQAFVDPKQRSMLVDLMSLLSEKGTEPLCRGLQSLFDEALTLAELKDPLDREHPAFSRYDTLVKQRVATLPVAQQISVKELSKWQE